MSTHHDHGHGAESRAGRAGIQHHPAPAQDPGPAHAAPANRAAHEHHAAAGAHPAGHDKHAGHSVAMFRDAFWLSLLLTLPTLVWGHMLQRALGYTAPHVPGAMYIPAAFGTAVFFYGGWPFLRG